MTLPAEPMHSNSKSVRFLATIYRIWMMRHVDVPDEVARLLERQMASGNHAPKRGNRRKPKYIPVVSIVNGCIARTTLVPAGGGHYRMQINTAQRKAAGADLGDAVRVELRVDLGSRAVRIPADLRQALAKHPTALRAFEKLPPGHRRQFILWLGAAKRPETRRKNLDRAIDHLLERALLGPRSGRANPRR
jgi:hypothetical protein